MLVARAEGWSGLRGSNPSNWLGKPGHYHYAKPAFIRILTQVEPAADFCQRPSTSNKEAAISESFAAVIAHVVFWIVLVVGWIFGALGPRLSVVFVAVWLAAFAGALRVPYLPFASLTAVLDIALVLIVFKGDVRLR
jgi:hypothetical protein